MTNPAEGRAVADEVVGPTPPAAPPVDTRRIRLATLDDVRVELAKVYRDARGNRLAMADATKLAFILAQLGRLTEVARIEQRLDEMQAALTKAGLLNARKP